MLLHRIAGITIYRNECKNFGVAYPFVKILHPPLPIIHTGHLACHFAKVTKI